ncbi:hypothetical protein KsCSTR_44490 [Candidatus Kuenenia stuttgartiensis]|uniref:Uncharacterized protein n=1 Tax=Kuenenia stuttgartiensis TaxID=174633 RepID=Q1PWX0_KUEST|nr:hypothetical protein KsCSTR_44490 [Candidatus Kuenenia stuttgartiensis]CAJ71720.1 unknown protein [Candidatus Kuenenia stuttgartiensis]
MCKDERSKADSALKIIFVTIQRNLLNYRRSERNSLPNHSLGTQLHWKLCFQCVSDLTNYKLS